MSERSTLVESGRSIMTASRLAGDDDKRADEKFPLGDLLLAVDDLDDEHLKVIAKEIGYGLTGGTLKSYREVARAWPPETRVDASWTTHRTLAKLDNRLELIKPGMTLRQAQQAAGKRTSDVKHPSRWPFDERVEFIITQLQDNATNEAVRERVDGRKKARAARAAARAVQEERSAEYRDALRELREANNAKHPERAVLDAIFKLRDAREYVRAVGKASTDEQSFVPEHRKPDVVVAVRDLAVGAVETLVTLGLNDPAVSIEALADIAEHLQMLNRRKVASGFSGIVIDAEAQGDVTQPKVTVLDAEPA
jgi:hypothetical protein